MEGFTDKQKEELRQIIREEWQIKEAQNFITGLEFLKAIQPDSTPKKSFRERLDEKLREQANDNK